MLLCLPMLLVAFSVLASSRVVSNQVALDIKEKQNYGTQGVCSGSEGLGIRYGHCYTMKDTSQRQIQRADKTYQMDSTSNGFKGLVFRICKSPLDCTLNVHEYVPQDGSWYQLDQMGYRDDTASGWLGRSGFTWTLTDITDKNQMALNFNATAVVIFNECALCLRLATTSYLTWMGTANYAGNDVLTLSKNPVSCRQFYYTETTCLNEVGVSWKL